MKDEFIKKIIEQNIKKDKEIKKTAQTNNKQ